MNRLYNNEGKLGVLVCNRHGYGWSGGFKGQQHHFLATDRSLVEYRLNNACPDTVCIHLMENGISAFDRSGIMQSWEHVEVKWVDPNITFIIQEYDGKESIIHADDIVLSS